jgi:hypothetical protein
MQKELKFCKIKQNFTKFNFENQDLAKQKQTLLVNF